MGLKLGVQEQSFKGAPAIITFASEEGEFLPWAEEAGLVSELATRISSNFLPLHLQLNVRARTCVWINNFLGSHLAAEVHRCSSTDEENQKEDEDAGAAGAVWCVRDVENLAISGRQDLGEGSVEDSQALKGKGG